MTIERTSLLPVLPLHRQRIIPLINQCLVRATVYRMIGSVTYTNRVDYCTAPVCS